MAQPFEVLMEVQQHDTTLDQLRHRRDTLPERAALVELAERRARLERTAADVQAQVDELAGRQRKLEDHIAATAKRRHEIEQRMRSGAISASRDLQALDHEVNQLFERQSHLEEDELVLLEEQEPLDSHLGELRSALASLSVEADRLTTAIAGAEAELGESIRAEEVQRKELANDLPEELSRRYEVLRSRLGGVGAARLVGDRCDGCHLTLPSVEVDRIRHLPPEEFATCTQCDRILVH
jgi:predicted  nucleic acid-binding Zn-ribbon protein